MVKVYVVNEVTPFESVLEQELQVLNLKQHPGALQDCGCDQLPDLADSTRDELVKEVGLPKVSQHTRAGPPLSDVSFFALSSMHSESL